MVEEDATFFGECKGIRRPNIEVKPEWPLVKSTQIPEIGCPAAVALAAFSAGAVPVSALTHHCHNGKASCALGHAVFSLRMDVGGKSQPDQCVGL